MAAKVTAAAAAPSFWLGMIFTGLGILRASIKLTSQQSAMWDGFVQLLHELFGG